MATTLAAWRIGFSVDGKRLLSTSNEESVLWDSESRTRIADGLPTMMMWPDPSQGGDRAVSADGENIFIWNLNTDEWYDIACRAAGRNMTPARGTRSGPATPRTRRPVRSSRSSLRLPGERRCRSANR